MTQVYVCICDVEPCALSIVLSEAFSLRENLSVHKHGEGLTLAQIQLGDYGHRMHAVLWKKKKTTISHAIPLT